LVFYDGKGEGVAVDVEIFVCEVDTVVGGHVAEEVEGAKWILAEHRCTRKMGDLRVEGADAVVFITDEVRETVGGCCEDEAVAYPFGCFDAVGVESVFD
jgi:hypothetical protein